MYYILYVLYAFTKNISDSNRADINCYKLGTRWTWQLLLLDDELKTVYKSVIASLSDIRILYVNADKNVQKSKTVSIIFKFKRHWYQNICRVFIAPYDTHIENVVLSKGLQKVFLMLFWLIRQCFRLVS